MSGCPVEMHTQSEARGQVRACLTAEDPRAAVEALVGDIDQAMDPSVLKVGAFALLKAPIVEGVVRYLEDPFAYMAGRESSDHQELADRVGVKVALRTREALTADPNLDMIHQINRQRGFALRRSGATAFPPDDIFETVNLASRSAAMSMDAAALMNATEIADTTDLLYSDRGLFIEKVKSSGELSRTLTRIHLNQLAAVHKIIRANTLAITEGSRSISINNVLRTDDEGIAHVAVPTSQWKRPLGTLDDPNGLYALTEELGNERLPDVQIGCLLSFAPEVTTRFYQHYVDLLERYQAWPVELQAEPAE